MIKLDLKTHTYYDEEGNKYRSISDIISQFEPKFDENKKIVQKVAQREKVSIEEIENKWKKIREAAIIKGKKVHQVLNDYIFKNYVDEKNKTLINLFNNINLEGILHSEKIFYDKENKIAGTVDLYEEIKNYINIYDFKTNKSIDFFNPYEESMMLYPIDHLSSCTYNKYSLQLSFYAYMIEKQLNKKIGKLGIIWIPCNVDDNDNDKIIIESNKLYIYPCNYMKFEIERILSIL